MKLSLEKKLIKKYPLLFSQVKQQGAIKNCMYFGVSVNRGWYNLIDRVCSEIYRYCLENNVDIPSFAQIKEKFGLLRIYMNGYDEEIDRIISNASIASYFICEDCGTTRDVSCYGTWILTLCSKCRKKHNRDRMYRFKLFRKLIFKSNKFMTFLRDKVCKIESNAKKREKVLEGCDEFHKQVL